MFLLYWNRHFERVYHSASFKDTLRDKSEQLLLDIHMWEIESKHLQPQKSYKSDRCLQKLFPTYIHSKAKEMFLKQWCVSFSMMLTMAFHYVRACMLCFCYHLSFKKKNSRIHKTIKTRLRKCYFFHDFNLKKIGFKKLIIIKILNGIEPKLANLFRDLFLHLPYLF